MNARRLACRSLSLGVALIMAGATAAAVPGIATASTCVSWTGTPPVNPSSSGDTLAAVTAPSPCDAWAVGFKQSGVAQQTLAEHWNGLAWAAAPSANPGGPSRDNDFAGVAATSASDAWAVGTYFNGTAHQTLIELPSNGTWEQVSSPDPGGAAHDNFLSAVAVTSARNAWAVGKYVNSHDAIQTLIEHWNGTTWRRVPSPDPGGSAMTNELNAVAAVSASSAWAVGSYFGSGGSKALIERWNGTTWKSARTPSLANASLVAVSALSARDAWAVGDDTASGNHTLTERWSGSAWRQVPTPNPGTTFDTFLGVATVAPAAVWAVGTYNSSGPDLTLAFHCC